MKTVFGALLLVLLTGSLLSCNSNDKSKNATATDSLGRAGSTTASVDSSLSDAAVVVAETHKAIRYLLDSNYAAATKSIETAIGKAEVVTSANPTLALIPIDVKVDIMDLIADMGTLQRITSEVKGFTDMGYFQAARKLLDGLASEITTATSSLPLATYPTALKEAARLTTEKKALQAALVLNTALSTIVVEAVTVPLPLIRAETFLDSVTVLLDKTDAKVQDINKLLDQADYQVHFAEALGYGRKDKEFAELYTAIKDIKAEVTKKGANAQKMNNTLKEKLRSFKNRISPKSKAGT